MELDELADTLSGLNDDGVNLYYHLTERDNGEPIKRKGIYTDSEKLSACAIRIEDTFFENPENYVDFGVGNPQTREKEIMVFIGCYDGNEEFLVRKVNNGEYLISSENILGYLDLDTKYFKANLNNAFDIGLDDSYDSRFKL